MLTCKQLSERATDYLENAVTTRQRLSIGMHLLLCKHCRAYVDQMAKTASLLKAAGRVTDEAVPDSTLLALFRNSVRSSKS